MSLKEKQRSPGSNKNTLLERLKKLPKEHQKFLWDNFYWTVDSGCLIIQQRNEMTCRLCDDQFCEEVDADAKSCLLALDSLTHTRIKELLLTFEIEGLPKLNSSKKIFLDWISEHFDVVRTKIMPNHAIIGLTDSALEARNEIRRFLAIHCEKDIRDYQESEFDMRSAVEHLPSLREPFSNKLKSLDEIVAWELLHFLENFSRNGFYYSTKKKNLKILLENSFIVKLKDIKYEDLLTVFTLTELVEHLEEAGIIGYRKSWSKSKLITWLVENQQSYLAKRYRSVCRFDISNEIFN